jgi:hypothetical protein
LANWFDADLRYLLGTFLFLTIVRALFGFPFASGVAIGGFLMCMLALWEVGKKAQADRNPEGGNEVPSRSDESPVGEADAP